MKVSINSKFLEGPHGGGIQFANYLRDFLGKNNIKVVNNLRDEDIDIILHINPFPFLTAQISAYSFIDAYIYKLHHPETIIIERVNECDERKGTHYMNDLLIMAGKYSDFIVFIASWLKPLLINRGLSEDKPSAVILNGADTRIFNIENKNFWDGASRIKIVTHHWSSNMNKGHDVYGQLDTLLSQDQYRNLFEFTYVGRVPRDAGYQNTNIVPSLSGESLAKELKKHHVYITASQNEPAGMHHIEGALCGLPLLYINSGALPEYCAEYGLEFDASNLPQKLIEMREKYKELAEKIKHYDHTGDKMAHEYLNLMKNLYSRRRQFSIKHSRLKILWFKVYNQYYALRFTILKRLGII